MEKRNEKYERFFEIKEKFSPLIKRSISNIRKKYCMDFRIEKEDLEQEADLALLNIIDKFNIDYYQASEHAYASFVNYMKVSLYRALNRYCDRIVKSTKYADLDCNTELNKGIKDNFYIVKQDV